MALLDLLGGNRAQMPGQQGGGLGQLLAPEVALPMAAALMGNQGNMGNFGNAFAAGGKAFAQTSNKNRTYQWLQQNAPEFAQLMDGGLDGQSALELYAKQRFAQKPAGNEVFGTPIYGKTPDGKTGLGVIGTDGQFRLLDTGGFEVTPGVSWQDLGTSVQPFDKSGAPVGPGVPVDNFGKSQQTAAGTAAGEQSAALPGKQAMAAEIDAAIQDLKMDPALGSVLGPVEGRMPTWMQGPDRTRVQSKINRVSGQAFLQARQMLKGGGAITDFESQKAEQAYARLSQAQSEADFIAALDEFNQAVQSGLAKLGGAAPAPAGGGGGYRILGVE